jgi:signal transduction histidine kinase
MEQKEEFLIRQPYWVVIGAIVIGYAVVLANALALPEFPYSPFEFIVLVVLGLVYTYVLLRDEQILGDHTSSARAAFYFLTLLALLTLTFLMVHTIEGVWLISMPLVGTGVAVLPRRWGWLLAMAVLGTIIVPVAFRAGVADALAIGVSLAPAVLFVIIFVRLWLNAEEAREKTQTLADQLESANRQLATYATQAEELATTTERNRLAREIHDSLGHYLTVINVQIEAARVVMAQNPEQAADALNKAQKLTQEGLASVRQSVAALRESPLGGRSLPEAIAILAEETRNSGIVTEFEMKGERRPLGPNTELTLYRVVQEGLTNVRKHARASRVDLTLDYRDDHRIQVIIQDNGIGSRTTNNGGFGLLGVRERVLLLDGKMSFETAPGEGFKLVVTVDTNSSG